MLVWTNNLSRMQWIASVPYLNSGTNLPRGSSYTEITQPSCGILKSINTFALSAINPLRPFGQALLQETDSALTDAVQLTGALQGLMMKIGHAWFAGQHLGQAAIQRLKRVLVPAKEDSLVWFAESTQANNAPVYNLSVLESQEYFANGILVHNCHARNYAEIALRHGLGDSMGVLEYYRKKAEDNEQKKAQQEPQ